MNTSNFRTALVMSLCTLASACGGGNSQPVNAPTQTTLPQAPPVSPPSAPPPPQSSEGPVGEVKDKFVAPRPVIRLSNTLPASKENLTVDIDLQGATVIVFESQGSGCGGLSSDRVSGSQFSQTRQVGSVGQCLLKADITTASGTVSYSNEFMVTPSSVVSQGLSFAGGVYFPSADLPAATATNLAVTSISAPQSFINGGTGAIYVNTANVATVKKVLVQLAGVPGYYVVPSTVENGRLRLDMGVSPQFLKDASSVTTSKDITVELVSADGRVSSPSSAPLSLQRVGSGTLQVSLSFDKSVDVDLHVVTPTNQDIYYGNRSSSGGSLDLDSNAGCRIDNVNSENIVWPDSANPAPGEYKIRVDYWSACRTTAPVNYTVRVTNCGVVSSYTGSFNSTEADGGGALSGKQVATVSYVPCAGYSVSGRATYEDFAPTVSGLSTIGRMQSIRSAIVEVRQVSSDQLLGKGETNENGDFSISFSMQSAAPYYVKVLASQDNESLKQSVSNNQGEIYTVRSLPIDAAAQARTVNLAIESKRAGSFAGAFNIFDVGLSATKEVKANFTTSLPKITWQWTAGVLTCGDPGTEGASCYSPTEGKIYVLGTTADPDEYDDSVLAHEFGHFFMRQLSKDQSPAGSHGASDQVAPALAWSEGAATYFGQWVLHSPHYIDTKSTGAANINIEILPSSIPTGTSDGTLSGKVSEALVAAILWDLADSLQDSKPFATSAVIRDAIANSLGVYSTLGDLKSTTHERGANGADLVDFLDQWLCSSLSTWDAQPDSNFRGLVSVINTFPYASQQPATCN